MTIAMPFANTMSMFGTGKVINLLGGFLDSFIGQ